MKTVIGLFRDREEAIRTITDLERVGAHHEDISVLSHEGDHDLAGIQLDEVSIPGMGQLAAGGPLTTFLHTGAAESAPDMLAAALVRMGIPRDEAIRYVDGVRQGYTLETVSIDDARAPEALRIMQAHAMPADFERGEAQTLRGQGLRGEVGGVGERTVPIAEEELDVGKREVALGGVRVQTRVKEKPVEEKVELREERVDVQRRAVDRAAEEGDELFQERSIELTANAERPVVTKRARVIEEIVLKKDVGHRTETIRENVRRTEADVQRTGGADYESGYREHYDREIAGSIGDDDYDYDSFKPAYRFGSDMRSDERFQGEYWDDVEPTARRAWEEKNPGTWEKMKLAVRHAWARAKS